jgi:hypothetical protein
MYGYGGGEGAKKHQGVAVVGLLYPVAHQAYKSVRLLLVPSMVVVVVVDDVSN